MPAETSTLKITGLKAGYGPLEIIRGLNLQVEPGEFVALMGPNGAGKSTLLKTLFGMTTITGGGIAWEGRNLLGLKPGDILRGERNPDYHIPSQPHFDTIEIKGGGDAVSAARAVIQTGEFDYAWNMQVEDDILKRMEAGGAARSSRFRAAMSSSSSLIPPIPGPRSMASARTSSRSIPP